MDNSVIVNNPKNSDNLSKSAQPSENVVKNIDTGVKQPKENQADIIQQKLKSNKAFFYGFPVFVIFIVFIAIFFFIFPVIQKYIDYQASNTILDSNIKNVSTTALNLQSAVNDEVSIDKYDQSLTKSIPEDAQLGTILNNIQNSADDFGLQRQFGLPTSSQDSATDERSSINSLATTGDGNKSLFESINSGEIEYQPKSISSDAKAKLLSIDVTIKGSKDNFFKFLEAMKAQKPLINLVYIDYTESSDNNITASLRFESYTLKLNSANTVVQATKLKTTDSKLTSPISAETFIWNQAIKDEISLN